jgi:MraZ protein
LSGFRGTFEHSLDAKHRLTIPAKFRAALAGGIVLAATPEMGTDAPRAVGIWPTEAYEEYTTAVLADSHPFSTRARELNRFLFGLSDDTELDSANRVMIPTALLQYAGLTKDVVVTGAGQCLEVFDRAAYNAYREGVLSRVPQIAASFDHTP